MLSMPGSVYIGTSGYSYSDWVGPVYPVGTDRSQFLRKYSFMFPVVELNFSYYRQPDSALLERMADTTSDSFRFSIKGHKSITHIISDEWKSESKRFKEGVAALADRNRLASILLQFPFSFHYTEQNRVYLARLCDSLSPLPISVEFRNVEWHSERVIAAMRARNIGYAATDYPDLDGLPPAIAEATSDVGYIRFHGRNRENWWTGDNASRYDYLYSDDEIDEWIERIRRIASQTRTLIAVFNNHWRGQAVQNAVMLTDRLRAKTDLDIVAADGRDSTQS